MPDPGDAGLERRSARLRPDLDAPVTKAAFFGRVDRNRPGITVALCEEAFARHAVPDQEIHDGLCTLTRKRQVRLGASGVIGMTANFEAFERS